MVRLLRLWIRKVFSRHVVSIVRGNLYRLLNREERLYRSRYAACSRCPERENVFAVGEICGICGCLLKAKLRVRDEKCELDKW